VLRPIDSPRRLNQALREGDLDDEVPESQPQPPANPLVRLARQPRILLLALAIWSILAALTQLFVNSPLFLDIHNQQFDGALGSLALSFNAVPLAVLYLYCSRNPARYPHIFSLAAINQGVMTLGVFYHWVVGTFTIESVVVPAVVSGALTFFSLLQVFEPRQS
jgi:hypothetical protein